MIAVHTFEQWQTDQLNNTLSSKLVLCPQCHGTTVITDECDCCGNEKEENCEVCEEHSGKVLWGDLNDSHKKEFLCASRYQEVLISDLTALASWKCRSKIEVLIEYGFTVYTTISNKLEVIVKRDSASLKYVNRFIQHG